MWVLQLNDMRSSNIEIVGAVARAETSEQLEELIEKETVPQYQDGQWRKSYRKGGLLEWCNSFSGLEGGIIDAGTEEDWINNAIEAYAKEVMSIPEVCVKVISGE